MSGRSSRRSASRNGTNSRRIVISRVKENVYWNGAPKPGGNKVKDGGVSYVLRYE